MKTRLLIILIFLSAALSALAAERVTLLVTITNTPADGNTLTVNGDVRTWKTSISTPATQILIGGSIGANATNLFNQIAANPYTGPLIPIRSGTNAVQLVGQVDQSISTNHTGTWGTLALSTNTVTSAQVVRVPFTAEPTLSVRTNIATGLVTGIFNSGLSTATVNANSAAMANFVDTSENQTVGGNKNFTGVTTINNASSIFTSGHVSNVIGRQFQVFYATNLAGIYFPDSATTNQFAISPDSAGKPSLYDISGSTILSTAANYSPSAEHILNRNIADQRYGVKTGNNSWTGHNNFTILTNSTIYNSTVTNSTYYGTAGNITNGTFVTPTLNSAVNRVSAFESYVNDSRNVELGSGAVVTNTFVSSAAIGFNSKVGASLATALGRDTVVTHNNSTAIGYSATTTAANQIRLGTAAETVSVPGAINANDLVVTNAVTLSGGTWNNAVLTNGINRGRAFFSFINDAANLELGTNATVTIGAFGSIAAGQGANAASDNSVALGRNASAGHSTSVAIGNGAATTVANQIRIGTATENVSAPGDVHVGDNLVIGHANNPTLPSALAKGLYVTNGVAASADPSNGVATWAASGEWQYRASASNEGSGATMRVHNRAAAALGSGTSYSLTGTFAKIDLGTTDPEITLPSQGTYLVTAGIQLTAGGTGGDQYEFFLYDSTLALAIGSIATVSNLGANEKAWITLDALHTTSGTPAIQIRGRNATAARGTVDAETRVTYVRLF